MYHTVVDMSFVETLLIAHKTAVDSTGNFVILNEPRMVKARLEIPDCPIEKIMGVELGDVTFWIKGSHRFWDSWMYAEDLPNVVTYQIHRVDPPPTTILSEVLK